jgi:hypothetical protein
MATAQISKRWPKFAKHAGAIASVGTFAAAWLGAHRVKYLEKYHHPLVVGSGLAALQSLIQLYVPKIGALLGDPVQQQPMMAGAKQAPLLAAPAVTAPIPQGFAPTTANEWYSYNDSFDAGSYKGKVEAAPPPTPGAEQMPDTDVSDLLDNSDLQLDNSDMGVFS